MITDKQLQTLTGVKQPLFDGYLCDIATELLGYREQTSRIKENDEVSLPMKSIPISAAQHIAKEYGYDQVVIVARRVGSDNEEHCEHCTTYGVDAIHCKVAARIGDLFKYKLMGWSRDDTI